ncbi:MAG: prolyl oligopeptidase family serine peptidase, partial [Acidimicrobiia bacterium]|nr:prolyl oligopeptidase family serine peptidase [Acidimicrobiia bacterium]
FEEADASVAAIVSLYGIFDFVNRNLTRPDWRVIPVAVMKATPAEEPELYRLASPIDHVRQEMPPMLVVHGSIDSLVPPQESRAFVEAAERVGGRVEYFEVPGAQHAFDAVNSPRTRAVVGVVTRLLEVTVGSPTPDLRG